MKDKKSPERGIGKVSHFFLSGPGPAPVKEKVTIRVAAKVLGVSRGTIVTYLNQGLLTRIKADGRIYVSMDGVKALQDKNPKVPLKASVSTPPESYKEAIVQKKKRESNYSSSQSGSRARSAKEKDQSRRPSTRFGLLENERQYLLKCREALEAKDEELATLTSEVNKLKRNLEIQASELKGTETRLRELEKEQQKRLVDNRKTTTSSYRKKEDTRVRLLAAEEKLKRLRRPWWQELFGHLQLRPERSGKKGVVLFSTFALFAVLIFSVLWFNRSPKQPQSPVTTGRSSGPGTGRATSQAIVDSEMQQEQPAGEVQQPSEPLQTTVAPEPEPTILKAPTTQPYSSNVEEPSSSVERTSPPVEADQQGDEPISTPPPYVLRVETLATTWLQVVIDGGQELEYLLHPNEKHTWRAESGFKLHIGNAAGLQLYLNDQPLKALGESGKVVHLQLPDPFLMVISN